MTYGYAKDIVKYFDLRIDVAPPSLVGTRKCDQQVFVGKIT